MRLMRTPSAGGREIKPYRKEQIKNNRRNPGDMAGHGARRDSRGHSRAFAPACSEAERISGKPGSSLVWLHLQRFIPVLHLLITFTRAALQLCGVYDPDVPAPILDEVSVLQGVGHQRNAGAPNAQHLAQKVLGQLHFIGACQVTNAKEPAAHASFDTMAGVACGGLLRLGEEDLLMTDKN